MLSAGGQIDQAKLASYWNSLLLITKTMNLNSEEVYKMELAFP